MPSFVLFTGPMFIGSVLNWFLLGVLMLQLYTYANTQFPGERLGVKLTVYTLFVLDVVQTIFVTRMAWVILVSRYGDPTVFLELDWAGNTVPIMAGLISVIAQLFYSWRIWILASENVLGHLVAILIAAVALMQSLSAIVNGIRFMFIKDIAGIPKLTTGVEVWLGGSFACDLLIAISMVAILLQHRRETRFAPTVLVLNRLMMQSIETGAVTAVAAGVELVLFILYPDNYMHFVPALILGKIYSNSVLATLNGRPRSQGASSTLVSSTVELSLRSHHDTIRRGTVVHINKDVIREQELHSAANFKGSEGALRGDNSV